MAQQKISKANMAKGVPVRWTVAETSKNWDCSPSLVRKYIKMGLIPVERIGGEERAAALIVLNSKRPDPPIRKRKAA